MSETKNEKWEEHEWHRRMRPFPRKIRQDQKGSGKWRRKRQKKQYQRLVHNT